MVNEENNIIQNDELQEKEKLSTKTKRLFIKHKNKIVIVSSALLLLGGSNVITSIISRKFGYKEGHEEGYEDGHMEGHTEGLIDGIMNVMNDPSMLGKGLNAFRKPTE